MICFCNPEYYGNLSTLWPHPALFPRALRRAEVVYIIVIIDVLSYCPIISGHREAILPGLTLRPFQMAKRQGFALTEQGNLISVPALSKIPLGEMP
jgi:hypothetical protein